MNWQTRVREASYIAPSGRSIEFEYENVSQSFDKKTSAYDFPDAVGTLIQDLGNTGRRFPMRIFFSGDDYDQDADTFDELLREIGTGILNHPMYGVVDVVPFGTVSRRDDLKTAANQAIFEVEFWQNNLDVYPLAQANPSSSVITSVDEYNAAAATAYDDSLTLNSPTQLASFTSGFGQALDTTKDALQSIADTQDDVRNQFNAVYDSIDSSIDILVKQPLTLGLQTIQLIQSPARALTSIQARLDGYANLAQMITSGDSAILPASDSPQVINGFVNDDLYASTYLTGSILSVVNTTFETRSDALSAADVLLSQLADLTAWRDDNFESLGLLDTGSTYQKLLDSVAIAAGFLVEISFTLKQERAIVLDRNRSLIDLVGQLYGEIDEQLDFFISSNNLSGSEIIELQQGKRVVYYV